MRFTSLALFASSVAAASYPTFSSDLSNNFPDISKISKTSLAKIFEHAGGTLPNGALPTKLTDEAQLAFQLVAAQEIFEVGYFTYLLKMVKDKKPGFETLDNDYSRMSIRQIRAQEEFHALGANAILSGVGAKTLASCEYYFLPKNFDQALELAETFTAVVLGVVPQIQAVLATDPQGVGLIPLVGSIIAQEGEQTGWFRSYLGKAPSAAPFLTGGAAQFAYSALRMFLVPGSCDFLPDVPFFPPITVNKQPTEPVDQMISYTVEGDVDPETMSFVYLSGQSLPFVEKIVNVKKVGKMTTFEASFPYKTGFAKGLSIGAVAKGKKFTSASDLADNSVYGPALILLD